MGKWNEDRHNPGGGLINDYLTPTRPFDPQSCVVSVDHLRHHLQRHHYYHFSGSSSCSDNTDTDDDGGLKLPATLDSGRHQRYRVIDPPLLTDRPPSASSSSSSEWSSLSLLSQVATAPPPPPLARHARRGAVVTIPTGNQSANDASQHAPVVLVLNVNMNTTERRQVSSLPSEITSSTTALITPSGVTTTLPSSSSKRVIRPRANRPLRVPTAVTAVPGPIPTAVSSPLPSSLPKAHPSGIPRLPIWRSSSNSGMYAGASSPPPTAAAASATTSSSLSSTMSTTSRLPHAPSPVPRMNNKRYVASPANVTVSSSIRQSQNSRSRPIGRHRSPSPGVHRRTPSPSLLSSSGSINKQTSRSSTPIAIRSCQSSSSPRDLHRSSSQQRRDRSSSPQLPSTNTKAINRRHQSRSPSLSPSLRSSSPASNATDHRSPLKSLNINSTRIPGRRSNVINKGDGDKENTITTKANMTATKVTTIVVAKLINNTSQMRSKLRPPIWRSGNTTISNSRSTTPTPTTSTSTSMVTRTCGRTPSPFRSIGDHSRNASPLPSSSPSRGGIVNDTSTNGASNRARSRTRRSVLDIARNNSRTRSAMTTSNGGTATAGEGGAAVATVNASSITMSGSRNGAALTTIATMSNTRHY
jgi:hypothetical protein